MYEEEISPELKKQYQDAFEMFDKDKDGTISAKELANVMETLIGQKPSMDEINSMIKEVDLNSDWKDRTRRIHYINDEKQSRQSARDRSDQRIQSVRQRRKWSNSNR